MGSNDATATSVAGASLVIAGPNNNYCVKSPDPSLKGLAIPIMVSRDCKTTEFGLGHTLNTQNYIEADKVPVKLMIPPADANHPLAAGLSGVIPVMMTKCRLVRADGLGPGAVSSASRWRTRPRLAPTPGPSPRTRRAPRWWAASRPRPSA